MLKLEIINSCGTAGGKTGSNGAFFITADFDYSTCISYQRAIFKNWSSSDICEDDETTIKTIISRMANVDC